MEQTGSLYLRALSFSNGSSISAERRYLERPPEDAEDGPRRSVSSIPTASAASAAAAAAAGELGPVADLERVL